jgi:CDP-glucose 4,6-dehydratase
MHINQQFWQNKKVFITGHTGFKGSWLTLWLSSLQAKVYGYALEPNTDPNLFNTLNLKIFLKCLVKS